MKQKHIESAETLKHELEQFVYIVSHDLQAPLRAIVSFSKLLQERYQGVFDEKGKKHFNYVVHGAEQMQQMIDGLLQYSRINTQPLNKSDVLLSALIDLILGLEREKILASQAHVTVGSNLPMVTCDKEQVVRILAHLLDNAIKFQPVGQKPEVTIDATMQEDGMCLVSVSDNGIGIEEKDFDKIFEVFSHLNHPSEYRGIGMGLPLAKKIIEKHNGELWVTSNKGKGSTFYFTIPGAKA